MELDIIDNRYLTLKNILNKLIVNAEEINFAVAFLKQSGVNLILEKINNLVLIKNGKFEIITGLDFINTEPGALKKILKISQKNKNVKLYCFSKFNKNNHPTFHSKLYIFRKSNLYSIIVGSSNLTKGGLINNFELNLLLKGTDNDNIILKIINAYLKIKLQESVFIPDLEYIERYELIFNTLRRSSKKSAKEIEKEINDLQEKEVLLPGTRPTLLRLIIEAIKNSEKDKDGYVKLQDIYKYVKIQINKLGLEYEMRHFKENLRKTIYFHLIGFDYIYNKELFLTKRKYSGLFKLTEKGESYAGR